MLKGAAVLGGSAALAGLLWQTATDDDSASPSASDSGSSGTQDDGAGGSDLDTLAGAVVGVLGQDGIPAIDEPTFVPASEADFLADDEPVFGLVRGGEVRAYPQLVLVWHEIVNDVVHGVRRVVTYCPLTGTVIGFEPLREFPDITFGTTGSLVNSNLLMYDRATGSHWPQVLGTAIRGELRGTRLDAFPLLWSTWAAWRAAHPDTQVLTTDTGFVRDYGGDPYGSYTDDNGYYAEGDPWFPVLNSDDRFDPKEVVVGVRSGNAQLAIPKELIRERGRVDTELGGTRLRATWHDALDTAQVVRRDDGDPADFLDAMWFAWYAFYPDTKVLA
ncbi:MAG: DUF3179 domain-containing protein [Propionibacteriales bacterium]|nr:DUF3179 domain-containing protein [Propionibacteriales bacterium]